MKANELLLTYAVNSEGELVHILDVVNGLKCACFCPNPFCSAKMIAKNKGKKKQPHFAHYKVADCGKSYESVLHKLAKEVLREHKVLMLPSYKDVQKKMRIQFDEVEVEQRNDSNDIQPDCVGLYGGMRYLIEIKVTHGVDEIKLKKIQSNRLICIEIDVSDMDLDKYQINQFFSESTKGRIWVNNPYLEEKHLQRVKEREEAQKNAHEQLLREQKNRILSYRKKYPKYHYLFEERCESCEKHTSIIKYQKWIDVFLPLPVWANFIRDLRPQDVVDMELGVRYTYSGRAYINVRGYWNYIYPKERKEKTCQHDKVYRLFKNIFDYCLDLCDEPCGHCKACFEYDDKSYIACDNDEIIRKN